MKRLEDMDSDEEIEAFGQRAKMTALSAAVDYLNTKPPGERSVDADVLNVEITMAVVEAFKQSYDLDEKIHLEVMRIAGIQAVKKALGVAP